jgi:hypothetical protein
MDVDKGVDCLLRDGARTQSKAAAGGASLEANGFRSRRASRASVYEHNALILTGP